MAITPDHIRSLAPDAPSFGQAEALARAGAKWAAEGSAGALHWAECQGSGGAPYRVAVHLGSAPQFRCTCPSRKRPCKHAMALAIKRLAQPAAAADLPDWLQGWPKTLPDAPADSADKAPEVASIEMSSRLEKRLGQMQAGAADLKTWLEDIVRSGMAHAARLDWEGMAARMVDVQMRNIARRLRELQLLAQSEQEWAAEMLRELAALYLLAEALLRFEHLPPALQDDVLTQVGVTTAKKKVLEQSSALEDWSVIGVHEGINIENAGFRRVWCYGRQQGRYGLLLEYDYGRGFELNWAFGQGYRARSGWYPGVHPLRIAVEEASPLGPIPAHWPDAGCGPAAMLQAYAQWLAQQPWETQMPALLADVRVQRDAAGGFLLLDASGAALPLAATEGALWQLYLLASSGPLDAFGEWDGQHFRPISARQGGRLLDLG